MKDPFEKFVFKIVEPDEDDGSDLAEWRRRVLDEPEVLDEVELVVDGKHYLLKNVRVTTSFDPPAGELLK